MNNNQKLAELYRKRTFLEKERFRRLRLEVWSGFPLWQTLLVIMVINRWESEWGKWDIWRQGPLVFLTIISIISAVGYTYNYLRIGKISREIVEVDKQIAGKFENSNL